MVFENKLILSHLSYVTAASFLLPNIITNKAEKVKRFSYLSLEF